MTDSKTGPNDWATANRKNTVRLGYWTFAWVATMAAAAFGPRLLWDYATLPTLAAVLVNLGVGFEPAISHLVILMCITFLVGMVAGHRRYL